MIQTSNHVFSTSTYLSVLSQLFPLVAVWLWISSWIFCLSFIICKKVINNSVTWKICYGDEYSEAFRITPGTKYNVQMESRCRTVGLAARGKKLGVKQRRTRTNWNSQGQMIPYLCLMASSFDKQLICRRSWHLLPWDYHAWLRNRKNCWGAPAGAAGAAGLAAAPPSKVSQCVVVLTAHDSTSLPWKQSEDCLLQPPDHVRTWLT